MRNRDLAKKQHVEDAIDKARRHLARLAMDIVPWNQGARTYDPEKERRHGIAMVKCAVEDLPKIPGNLPAIEILRRVIPALERTRPAQWSHGHSTDEWHDRNQLIVETIKLICRKYGFRPDRNPATKEKDNPRECGFSIISAALKKLDDQLGWFEKVGFEKPQVALSEKTIKGIWANRHKL